METSNGNGNGNGNGKRKGGPRPGSGRPKLVWTPEKLHQAELLAGYGLTLPQIGAVLGCGDTSLTDPNQANPLVVDALERGRAKAQGLVGKALFRRAIEGDVAAIRWWEMTRAGRRETHVQVADIQQLPDDVLVSLAAGKPLPKLKAI